MFLFVLSLKFKQPSKNFQAASAMQGRLAHLSFAAQNFGGLFLFKKVPKDIDKAIGILYNWSALSITSLHLTTGGITMQGVEISHCNAAISAILKAASALWNLRAEEALSPLLRYGKTDTLALDAAPEISICETLQMYDKNAIIITEEAGAKGPKNFFEGEDPRKFRTVYLCDPTDRSKQIEEFLSGFPNKKMRVGEIVRKPETQKSWEEKFGSPVSITGGFSAITCIRRSVPIFSVLVNYITCQLFVSCSAGNYSIDLPEKMDNIDLKFIWSKKNRIFFKSVDSLEGVQKFVTFMGKSGYKENFLDSKLISEEDMSQHLHYNLPGGPSRILYLSLLQPKKDQIGFILANGEKIGEWIHWIPFIRFARREFDQNEQALRLFEIFQDRPNTKDGILMAPPPYYSIFSTAPMDSDKMVMDMSQFSRFPNPSRIRSTLVVAPADNPWAIRVLTQYGYRMIDFYSE